MGSSTLLGPDHPLARAESQERTLRAQFAVTVVFGLVVGVLSPLLGQPAVRLSMGAAAVAAFFLSAAFVARIRLRGRAFELIASGREELPVEAIASERSRLRDRSYRRKLARTLQVITLQPQTREWWSPIYADRASVVAARPELLEVARLLRDLPSVSARGVALVTRLVRDGATSPLYQGPAVRLQEELGRIRHVLIET
jgi:hypothetical protein